MRPRQPSVPNLIWVICELRPNFLLEKVEQFLRKIQDRLSFLGPRFELIVIQRRTAKLQLLLEQVTPFHRSLTGSDVLPAEDVGHAAMATGYFDPGLKHQKSLCPVICRSVAAVYRQLVVFRLKAVLRLV